MAARRKGTGKPGTRQKARRAMPVEEGGRGRIGKREVRAPRGDPKQRGADPQRRRSGP